MKNITKDINGRLRVKLTFRDGSPFLGASREIAGIRFFYLEPWFLKNEDTLAQYVNFSSEL